MKETGARRRKGKGGTSAIVERHRWEEGELTRAQSRRGRVNRGLRGGSFSFVSRRNKGISDDKCQACTRSTGSASKESSRRGGGLREDVGRPGAHPFLYKEPPVKNNTIFHDLPYRADRPDSANYSFLRGSSAKRGVAARPS